jgi:hypothetical protein
LSLAPFAPLSLRHPRATATGRLQPPSRAFGTGPEVAVGRWNLSAQDAPAKRPPPPEFAGEYTRRRTAEIERVPRTRPAMAPGRRRCGGLRPGRWHKSRPSALRAVRYPPLARRARTHITTPAHLAACLSGTQYTPCGSGPPAATQGGAILEDVRRASIQRLGATPAAPLDSAPSRRRLQARPSGFACLRGVAAHHRLTRIPGLAASLWRWRVPTRWEFDRLSAFRADRRSASTIPTGRRLD